MRPVIALQSSLTSMRQALARAGLRWQLSLKPSTFAVAHGMTIFICTLAFSLR